MIGIAGIAEQARGWERGCIITIMMLSQKSCRSSCQSVEDDFWVKWELTGEADHSSVTAESEREM